MGDPIELTTGKVNKNEGGAVYEALSNNRMQEDEYMTISAAIDGDTRKHQADQQGAYAKNDQIEKALVQQANTLKILKVISVFLAITVAVVSVTVVVLIYKVVS